MCMINMATRPLDNHPFDKNTFVWNLSPLKFSTEYTRFDKVDNFIVFFTTFKSLSKLSFSLSCFTLFSLQWTPLCYLFHSPFFPPDFWVAPVFFYFRISNEFHTFLANSVCTESSSVSCIFSLFSCLLFSSMASNLINIRWITTGSLQFWKTMYSIVIQTIFTNLKIKIIKLIPVLLSQDVGPSRL